MSFESGGSGWKPSVQKTQLSGGFKGSSGGYVGTGKSAEKKDDVFTKEKDKKSSDINIDDQNIFMLLLDLIKTILFSFLEFFGFKIKQDVKEDISIDSDEIRDTLKIDISHREDND
jgi:hypothetical protein